MRLFVTVFNNLSVILRRLFFDLNFLTAPKEKRSKFCLITELGSKIKQVSNAITLIPAVFLVTQLNLKLERFNTSPQPRIQRIQILIPLILFRQMLRCVIHRQPAIFQEDNSISLADTLQMMGDP